ncbi:MAG: rhomboid family intramembrane serine protease, partial [Acinetobacter sp.]|nr:rhomboid family intramembrane serine protease [Acinetobacter sp.]
MADLLGLSHTFFIILITALVSILAWRSPALMDRLILWPPAIQKGQYDRFISSGFIHADGMHLLFNMITLFFFGRAIEAFYTQYLSGLGFILFYLGGMIIASIPSYLSHRQQSNWASLGASGAVSAVLFAFILFDPWNLIFVFFIPMPAIIFAVLYIAYSIWASQRGQSNINHSA